METIVQKKGSISCGIERFNEVWDKYPKNTPAPRGEKGDWSTHLILFQTKDYKVILAVKVYSNSKEVAEILSIAENKKGGKLLIGGEVSTARSNDGLVDIRGLQKVLSAEFRNSPVKILRAYLLDTVESYTNDPKKLLFYVKKMTRIKA